jgi:hypothetical protein
MVFGGAAIETLLLWAIGAWTPSASHKKPIEHRDLSGLIEAAHAHGLIRNETSRPFSLITFPHAGSMAKRRRSRD